MTFFRRGMQPQNAFTATTIRFVPHFESLRISWTHNSLMSEGVERFIDEFLPIIRQNNPHVKFVLLRTHTECDPFIVGEYAWLRSRRKRCSWRTKHQVLSMVEEMSIGGDYRPGKKRGVNKRLPRGQELWDTETMGHDVYKIYSKWKDDPKDPNEITAVNHPHFVHRKY
uniref:Ribosomal protein/NADH dehydrogenase domain-containing protein n=1 Tax=Parascaris univalens TaxID=6257 RepID=A0A914ZRM9_PARUN